MHEHHPAHEERQPSLYDELTSSIDMLARQSAAPDHSPLLPDMPAGLDGSQTPDGEPVELYEHRFEAAQLPDSLRQLGIDGVLIGSCTAVVMYDEHWPARTWVTIHHSDKTSKDFSFHHEVSGTTATSELVVDEAGDSDTMTAEATAFSTITDLDKDVIIGRLMIGDSSVMDGEDITAAFARKVHLGLSQPTEPTIDDIEHLRWIVNQLQHR